MIIRRVWNILSWTAVVLLVTAAMVMLSLKIFGYKPYAVISGSMEPTYHVGSLVFVKETPVKELHTGDAVSFVVDEKLTVATHRIVDISADGEYFYTKGDANQSIDPSPVYYKNLIGKVEFSISNLGYISIWMTSTFGKIVLISAAVLLIAVVIFYKLLQYRKTKQTPTISEVGMQGG